MKPVFFAIILATQSALFALSKVTGKIDSVTVFPDRALVKRVLPIVSTDKTGTVRFITLPQSLVADSVRASGDGATVTAVSLRHVDKVYGEEWEEHPLKKSIIRIEEAIHRENDRIANFRDQIKVLDSMMRLTTASTDRDARSGTIDVEAWGRALAFLEKKRQFYQENIRASDTRLDSLRRELNKAQLKFKAITEAAKTSGTEVEVSYALTREKGVLELEYLVTSVSWNGIYDLRGSAEGSDFHLVSHAIIRQSTGEAWTDAKVTLSTARPSTSTSPGILSPWRVGESSFSARYAKNSVSGKMAAGSSSDNRAEEADIHADKDDAVDMSDTATVSITLPGRENILSDDSDHRVTLGRTPLKGTLSHVAVPSLSQYVYLKARLKNTSGAPLMGTLSAFLDGSFVGNVVLKTPAAVGEEFDVFLGPDQRMQLKRTLKRGDVEASGLFGGKVEVSNQWEIEVANFTKKPRQITVFDQYPITADPNVSTKYLGASRAEATKDANGILSWKLDIASGSKVKFDFSYALTFPKEAWERFSRGYDEKTANTPSQSQYYQGSPRPSAAPAQRQYNLEKMLRK